jgi:4-hydroxybenzoate polyprenyltransferase
MRPMPPISSGPRPPLHLQSMSRLRALLATLRIANAPSVVSNVWLGFVLGWALNNPLAFLYGGIGWRSPLLPVLSGLLLYFAGNLANDWFDRDWDRLRRPERALPSGLFPSGNYLAAAIVAALLGVACAFATGVPCGLAALFILVCVILYTWIHKRTAWSVIPMGLCRAGLYALGFLTWCSLGGNDRFLESMPTSGIWKLGALILTLGSGLLAYIAGLSMSARYEGMADAPPGPKAIARALLVYPFLAMTCWILPMVPAYGWIGMIPYGLWLTLCLTRYRRPIPAHVSALLAGIPLVDAIFLLPVGTSFVIESEGHPLSVFILLIPLAAFVLGRLLQKVAPAT